MANPKSRETAVHVTGVRQLLKALSKIDKDLQAEVRDASQDIATDLVSGAKNAAATPLQNKVAGGLKVKRDRVPVVSASGKVDGIPMRDIFYGAEFGGGRRPTTQQFTPHQGRRGYFLYPTARARGRHYAALWADAVDQAFKAWDYRAPKG
jgi:hypothetical protein